MDVDEIRAVKEMFDAYCVTLDAAGSGRLALRNAAITFNAFNIEGDFIEVEGDLFCASEFVFKLSRAGGIVIAEVNNDRLLTTSAGATARVASLEPTLRDELGGNSMALAEGAKSLFEKLAGT